METTDFQDIVIERRRAFIDDEEAVAKDLQKALRKIQRDALDSLAELEKKFADGGEFDGSQQAARSARRKIAELQRTISSVTTEATSTLIKARKDAFQQGVTDIAFAIDKTLGGSDFKIEGSFDVVNKLAAKSAREKPVLGVKPAQAFNGVKKSIQDKYSKVFMNAVLNGEDTRTTAKRLKDIGGLTERAATRIARTNLNAAMNDGLSETIHARKDLFDGYTWSSTLDNRTSDICRRLDGKFFPLGKTPPGPPAHPNCRSTLIPHFRDDDIQKFLDKQDRRARNPKTGKNEIVKGGTTYKEWDKKNKKK